MIQRLGLPTFLATLLLIGPSAAQGVVSEAREQARFTPPAILPEPAMRLGWNSPDKGFFIAGEAPKPARAADGVLEASGTGTVGARHGTFAAGPLTLSTTSVMRAEAAWEGSGTGHQALGVAVFEEAGLTLPQGFRLLAKGGLGDPVGLATGGSGLPTGLAAQGEAGLSGPLAPATRFDLRVKAGIPLAGFRDEEVAARCEVRLELTRSGIAPLAIGSSCPGAGGEGWVTLTIGGRF